MVILAHPAQQTLLARPNTYLHMELVERVAPHDELLVLALPQNRGVSACSIALPFQSDDAVTHLVDIKSRLRLPIVSPGLAAC